LEVFNNYVPVVLNGSVTSGAASGTVNGDYLSLSATGNYRVRIDDEIFQVTSRAGNVLNWLRAQEGTFAASHASGAQVIPIVTAGALAQLEADAAAGIRNIQTPGAPGTFAAAPGMTIYVDLDVIGGNLAIAPAGIAKGQEFEVKLIGTNAGGFTCSVEAMGGGQIENRMVPGQLVAGPLLMTQPGDRLEFESPDGTNLYI
jgi:hypothetical protein